ncbi:hypothetical protein F5H01DRAFT_323899 [Linnemannia elongata]|nr:hypothetical protein F5H01DRAFT_323899 [Linnemannia elongata]
METFTPSTTSSHFSSPQTMMTHLETLTHRLAIQESQQRQIDPVQDDSKLLDQIADTQMSTNVNTTVTDNQSPLPLPALSTPSSSLSPSTSTSTSAALSSPADKPKTALVKSPITSMTKSPTPNSTTPTTTTTSSTKNPPATPGGSKKLPAKAKTTKSSSKPTKQSQKNSIQSCPSPKVQLRLDSFLVSKKPSLAYATKPVVDSETKKPPGKTNLKLATNASSNISNQPPPALKTPTTTAAKSTSATTSSTTLLKPKSRVRVRVRTKPARTPPSTNTTKPTEPTTSSPVEKRTITRHKISNTPPSPPKPRLKANIFFGLLPPPTVTTANRKADETLRREGDPNPSASMNTNTAEKHKNALKAESDTSSTPPPADTNVAKAKLNKVKNFVTDSNDSSSTGSTTVTGKDALPTEVVASRVFKSMSSLSERKYANAPAVKTGPDKPVVPAASKCTTTPPLVTNKKSMPVEISSRVIKIKSSAPESKSRPTTATPTRTTTPTLTVMAMSETASLRTVQKPTKVSCTSKNAMTTTAICKTKTLPSPISKSVIAPVARSKKPSNTAPLSCTKTTSVTTTTVVVVPKTKSTSKGASITSKLSSKESTLPKTLKSSSTTTIATTTSVSKDNSTVQKPSKNLTISTSSPKNNNKDNPIDKKVRAATKPAAQTFNPILPQQTQQPSPPSTTTSISSILPSPISPSWPNEDMSMDSPAFSPTTSTQTPRRTNFAFNTSPSGIVLSLSTNHNHLQTQNRQFATSIPATGTTTTTSNSCQPAPAQALHSPLDRTTPQPPRPKRVLELMLQSDHENDSPYYNYLRRSQRNPSTSQNDITSSSSSLRPQKRQRLADISAESTAGRTHGMFGQTAFEQALDAMSFKFPTPARCVPGPATASQRLRLFQKRRREASTSTMAVGRRVVGGGGGGGRGAPRWIP